jgi:hypothetical protein
MNSPLTQDGVQVELKVALLAAAGIVRHMGDIVRQVGVAKKARGLGQSPIGCPVLRSFRLREPEAEQWNDDDLEEERRPEVCAGQKHRIAAAEPGKAADEYHKGERDEHGAQALEREASREHEQTQREPYAADEADMIVAHGEYLCVRHGEEVHRATLPAKGLDAPEPHIEAKEDDGGADGGEHDAQQIVGVGFEKHF